MVALDFLKIYVAPTLFCLLTVLQSDALANESILSEEKFEDNLHGELLPAAPVIVDLDGRIHVGIGATSESFTGELYPLAVIGGDYEKKIIRLPLHDRQRFHLPANNLRYQIIKKERISLGLGLAFGMVQPVGPALIAACVPDIGGERFFEKSVNSKSDRSQLHFKIPQNIEDLNGMAMGDSVGHIVWGGVLSFGGVGATILLKLGGMHIFEHRKLLRVKKIGPTTVKVELFKSNNNELGGIADVSLGYSKASSLWFNSRDYTYTFDLSKPRGLASYLSFLHGRPGPSDEAAQIFGSGVRDYSFERMKATGRYMNVSLGFPGVYIREWDRRNLHVDSFQLKNHASDLPYAKTIIAVAMKRQESIGVASRHLVKRKSFYSQMHILKDKRRWYAGTFKWFYERARLRYKDLRKQLDKIGNTLGLEELGSHLHPYQDKGYARAELDIPFSQRDFSLLEKSLFNLPVDAHQTAIREKVADFFKRDPHPDRICSVKAFCKRHLAHDSAKFIEVVYDDFIKISELRRSNRSYMIPELLAHLGYKLVHNRFIFAYIASLIGHPLTVELRVLGEYIDPLYEKHKKSPENHLHAALHG